MPITHIAPAVVAVFVEAIDRGELTAADVVAVVGAAEFGELADVARQPAVSWAKLGAEKSRW